MHTRPAQVNTATARIERLTGVVKWWDDTRGYGFITRDDGRGDLFVHFRALPNRNALGARLEKGEAVSFTIAQSPKGPMAAGVEFI
jgi:CspA family cold shock protein